MAGTTELQNVPFGSVVIMSSVLGNQRRFVVVDLQCVGGGDIKLGIYDPVAFRVWDAKGLKTERVIVESLPVGDTDLTQPPNPQAGITRMAETTNAAAAAVVSRETETLAIVIATLLIQAEEREAMGAPCSAANYRDEVMVILRNLLGNRSPLLLFEERSEECGAIRLRGTMQGDRWRDYYDDPNWHRDQTPDAMAYARIRADLTQGETKDDGE